MTRLALILTLLAVGCRDRVDTTERTGYSKTSETARDDFEQTRKTYSVHVNERLQKLDERLRELAQRGTQRARDAANQLRIERDRLAPRVNDAAKQTKAGWDRFETELSRGFDNLENRLEAAFQND
jgi:hypothetical protein